MIEILSIELTNKCSKACSFCYNASNSNVTTSWDKNDLINFVNDCVDNDVKVISFGGGEPLEYKDLIEILEKTKGIKTLTTNGLLLNDNFIDALKRTLTKLQVSIHFPHDVDRVINQVLNLRSNGVTCGVNLLVRSSQLAWTKETAIKLYNLNIPVIYLPMRVFNNDEPSAEQVYKVSSHTPFESVHCLTGCEKSTRFASIDFNHKVGWCSYTSERKEISPLTFKGLTQALDGLSLTYCGESSRLVKLGVKHKKHKKEKETVKRLTSVDLPVATGHSTDTSWFALDTCGHLANFWSSESGAVPETVIGEENSIEGILDEHELLNSSNVKEFIQTFDLLYHVKDPRNVHQAIFKTNKAIVAVAVPALLSNKVDGQFFNGRLLLSRNKSYDKEFLDIYTQFHRFCISCFHFHVDFPVMVRQGVFCYRHPYWNSQAFPYRRIFVPAVPIIVKPFELELPAFDSFCFARKRKIQPKLYLACNVNEDEDKDDNYIKGEDVDVDSGLIL